MHESGSSSRLRFRFLPLFSTLLLLLLLFIHLRLILPLQVGLLFCRLGNWLEEALQPTLLRCLQILPQPSGPASHPIFVEPLLFDQELDKSVHIGGVPFEVAFRIICRADIRLKEEETRISVGPVLWDGIFRGLGDGIDNAFEVFMLTDEFESSARPNALNRVKVVASKEDAEIDELERK